MSEQEQVFVDYVIFSPFGRLRNTAGPFSAKEAQGFIEELKAHHKQMLLQAALRSGPAPDTKKALV